MKFSVTEKHIAMGKSEDPCCCPVALCLKEAGLVGVEIEEDAIHFEGKDGFPRSIETPVKVKAFLWDFDGQFSVAPFEFELEVEDA